MEPNIELAKLREFGEIISDTFQFIRQNFKNLLKYFFIFCGFFIIANMGIAFVQQYKIMHSYNEIINSAPRTFNSSLSDMWITSLISGAVSVLTITSINVMVLCFIALYKQRGNTAPTSEEMWAFFKYYYLRVLGSSVVVWILLFLGFMLCLIPGVYLFPIFSLILPIMVIENGSLGHSFNRSFTLIKENWWSTAGAVFIIWVITYFIIIFVTIPTVAVSLASLWLTPGSLPQLSIGKIAFSLIVQNLAQVILIIPTIGVSLCYFNLAENKEGNSLLDKINQFGTNNTQSNLPTEEY